MSTIEVDGLVCGENMVREWLSELDRLRAENKRLSHQVADLERTAQCAEDMRDASDAENERLAAALRDIVCVGCDEEDEMIDPEDAWEKCADIARAAILHKDSTPLRRT